MHTTVGDEAEAMAADGEVITEDTIQIIAVTFHLI
jgi:hypothetical protein